MDKKQHNAGQEAAQGAAYDKGQEAAQRGSRSITTRDKKQHNAGQEAAQGAAYDKGQEAAQRGTRSITRRGQEASQDAGQDASQSAGQEAAEDSAQVTVLKQRTNCHKRKRKMQRMSNARGAQDMREKQLKTQSNA